MTLSPETLICPNCSKEISGIRCMKCGGNITTDLECSKCGAKISSIVCPHCKELWVFKPVDWKLMPKPSSELADALILRSGEEVLAGWSGDREYRSLKEGSKKKWLEKGSLVLTNKSLIWVAWRDEDEWQQSFAIPLENVKDITDGGIISKYISIDDGTETYRFHLKSWLDGYRKLIDSRLFRPFIEAAMEYEKHKDEPQNR